MIKHPRSRIGQSLISLVTRGSNEAFQRYLLEQDLAARAAPVSKVARRGLFLQYESMAKTAWVPSIDDVGYRVYSQFDEEGIFVFLFAVIGTQSRKFVEIGASDGINSNCANVAVNVGWHGLFVDGNPEAVARGQQYYAAHPDGFLYPPRFVNAMVKRPNVNGVIADAGFAREIDLLSIDIDGNDYWIWDALECVRPRVVCVETHIEFGCRDIVVPYDEDYVYPGVYEQYHSASPVAMVRLAKRKGYRLVGANFYGSNTIYVRDDLALELIPTQSVGHILRHPRKQDRLQLFDANKEMPYVAG